MYIHVHTWKKIYFVFYRAKLITDAVKQTKFQQIS